MAQGPPGDKHYFYFLKDKTSQKSHVPRADTKNLHKGCKMDLNLQADKLVKVIMPLCSLVQNKGIASRAQLPTREFYQWRHKPTTCQQLFP